MFEFTLCDLLLTLFGCGSIVFFVYKMLQWEKQDNKYHQSIMSELENIKELLQTLNGISK